MDHVRRRRALVRDRDDLRRALGALALLLLMTAAAALAFEPAPAQDAPEPRSYSGLTDAAAWRLAQRHLPETAPLLLPRSGRVTLRARAAAAPAAREIEYRGRHSALVRSAGDERGSLVLSSAPLRVERGGRLTPVDLALRRDRRGFLAPGNAGVDVRISPTLEQDSRLANVGVAVRPLVAQPKRMTARAANHAFFANASDDTDVDVSAAIGGLEVTWVLRSRRSPEQLRVRVGATRGVRVTRRGGEFVLRRRGGGRRLAVVRRAVAWDARSRPVAVRASRDGDELVYTVAHRARPVAYPITVDPKFEQYGGPAAGGGSAFQSIWQHDELPAGHTTFTSGPADNVAGLRYEATGTSTPTALEWRLPPIGESVVSEVSGVGIGLDGDGGADRCAYFELRRPNGQPYTRHTRCAAGSHAIPSIAVAEGDYASSRGNMPVFGFAPGATATDARGWLATAYVVLDDRDPPALVRGRPFDGFWGSGVRLFSFVAADAGLGIQRVDAPAAGGTVYDASGCGTHEGFCNPQTWSMANIQTDDYPEGISAVPATAWDAVGNRLDDTFDLYVDRTPPEVGLNGALLSGGFASTPRSVDIEATDDVPGDQPANRRAGVRSIRVKVDGVTQGDDATQQPCDHSCSLSRTYTFDPNDFEDGEHTLEVIATDRAGNERTVERRFLSDTDGPRITLSGPLKEAEGQPLTKETYRLDMRAEDSPGGRRGAGVKWVRVLFDDGSTVTELDHVDNACDTDSCAMDHAWTLETERFTEGEIVVRSRDKLEHESEARVDVLPGPSAKEVTGFSGLEEYMHYDIAETGGGSRAHVNLTTGNVVWNHVPLVNPGRGLSTFVNVTYNAQTRRAQPGFEPYDELGEGFSIGASGLTRLNEPLDVTRAESVGTVVLVDPDGTRHQFERSSDGTHFEPPPGVNLHLRRHSTSDEQRAWSITRPDGVTYLFDRRGFQTFVLDRNENVLRYEYEIVPLHPAATCPVWGMSPNTADEDDCRQRVVGLTDSAGVLNGAPNRTLRVAYTSPSSRIASLTDHAGRALRLVYSGGRLTTLIEADGTPAQREFRFFYGPYGMASVMDPRGAETRFAYTPGYLDDWSGEPQPDPLSDARATKLTLRNDGARHFVYGRDEGEWTARVTDARGSDTHFRLDHRARLVRLQDATGVPSALEWDGDNNVVRIREAAGTGDEAVTNLGYNENGLLLRSTDPELNRTELRYRESEGVFPQSDVAAPDTARGFVSDLVSLTSPLGTATGEEGDYETTFEPDDRGNVRSRTDAEGHTAFTDFDSYGQITSETDEVGNTTRYQEYDPNGEAQVVFDAKGGRSEFRYDRVGNLLATTDPRAEEFGGLDDSRHRFQSRFAFDARDRLVEEILPKDSRTGAFITRRYDYDPNDNEIRSVDGNGNATTQTHDDVDDVVLVRRPPVPHAGEQQPVSEVARRTYDPERNLLREEAPRGTENVESAVDFSTAYQYDATGRVVVVRQHSHERNGNGEVRETSMHYDPRGNVVGVADPKRNRADDRGPLEAAADPAARRLTLEYDRADRQTASIEDPGGENLRTEYHYDRNDNLRFVHDPRKFEPDTDPWDYVRERRYDRRDLLTDEIDAMGRRTTYERRADGRVVTIRSPRSFGGDATGDDFRELLAYDELGSIVRRTIPKLSAAYEPHGGRTWIYDRDPVGNPRRVTDPRGNAYENTFLDSGQVKTTTRPGAWRFDPGAGEREVAERDWREIGSAAETPQLPGSEGEGDFGAVEGAAMPGLLPKAGPVELGYDDELRLTSVVERAGTNATVTLQRDALGRLTEVARPIDATRRMVNRHAYDRNGNLAESTDAEGNVTLRRYDQFDRLVELETPPSGDGSPDVTRYAYDANGLQVEKRNPRGFVQHTCRDALDRVIARIDAERQVTSFDHDAVGNVTMSRSPRGNLPAGDCAEAVTPEPDAGRFETTMTYDSADQLRTRREGLASAGKQTSFDYDLDGNQILVDAPGSRSAPDGSVERRRTERTFDARGKLWREIAGEGAHRRVTITEFDGNGNLRRQVNPRGVENDRPRYADAAPARTDQASPADRANADVALASEHASLFEYSDDNLLTAIHRPHGGAPDQRHRHGFHHDARGRVRAIDGPHEWSRDPALCSRNALDPGSPGTPGGQPGCIQRRTFEHYETGWIRRATEPEGRMAPDRPVGGEATTYEYDRRGLQTEWHTLTAAGAERRVQRRTYWPSGLLRQRRAETPGDDAATRIYDYRHSSTGHVTSVVDRGAAREETERDDDRTYRMAYDRVDRRVAVDEQSPAPNPGKDTLLTYDRDGNVDTRKVDGTLSHGVADGVLPEPATYLDARTTDFDYDEFGRETEARITRPHTDAVDVFRTDWYASDDRQQRTEWHDPPGADPLAKRGSERWFYLNDGRKARTERRDSAEAFTKPAQDYDYDGNGNPKKNELGDHEFNARDQLVKWTRRSGPHANTSVDYEVTGAGDVAREQDQADGSDTRNAYSAGRLVESVNGSETTSYTYDATGANVAEIKRNGTTESSFEYDSFDRQKLQRAHGEGGRVEENEFTFDAFDRRDSQAQSISGASGQNGDVNGERTARFSYVGLSESLSQREPLVASQNKQSSYDYDSGLEVLGQTRGEAGQEPDAMLVYAKQGNGSVEGLLNEQGQFNTDPSTGTQARYAYDPYGNQEKTDGESSPGSSLEPEAKENPFRFQGHYFDSGVKTYDMRARMYMPQAGRFLQQDRFESSAGDFNLVADPLTQNRYAFAGGNPISRVEFDGHDVFEDLEEAKDDAVDTAEDAAETAKDVGEGFGEGAAAVGKEAFDTAKWAYKSSSPIYAVTNPKGAKKQWEENLSVANEVRKDPVGAAKQVGKSFADPIKKAYEEGGLDKAIGRGLAEGAGAVVGGKGVSKLGKLGKVGKGGGGKSDGGKGASGRGDGGSSRSESRDSGRESGKANACGNSFTADTPVLMADGTRRRIADVRRGDRVLATDPLTGEDAAQTVTALIRGSGSKALVDVDLGGETLTATDDHPFAVDDRGWVDAGDLRPGDRLLRRGGEVAVVRAVERYTVGAAAVHNLTVARAHTFRVGALDVLVHNCPEGDDPPKIKSVRDRRTGEEIKPPDRSKTQARKGDPREERQRQRDQSEKEREVNHEENRQSKSGASKRRTIASLAGRAAKAIKDGLEEAGGG